MCQLGTSPFMNFGKGVQLEKQTNQTNKKSKSIHTPETKKITNAKQYCIYKYVCMKAKLINTRLQSGPFHGSFRCLYVRMQNIDGRLILMAEVKKIYNMARRTCILLITPLSVSFRNTEKIISFRFRRSKFVV